jgi:tetratricopeptide (TPR) repeat protein
MFRRVVASAIALLIGCGLGHAQSLAEQRCSLSILEADEREALAACDAVLERRDAADSVRAAALNIRGRALNRIGGRSAEASASFKEALRLAPDNTEFIVRRGWIAIDDGDLELAASQARQALKINPEYASAYNLIGAVFAVSGVERIAEAKAAYEQAIRLDPADPEPRYHLHQLLINHDPQAALREVDELLRMPAEAITKRFAAEYDFKQTTLRIAGSLGRAWTLKLLGRRNEAAQAFDDAVNADPDVLTYARRAEFKLFSSGPDNTAVQEDLDKAFALDSEFWFARETLALLYFYKGRSEAAATEFERALKQQPNNGSLRWWYARTLRKLGRIEDASREAVAAFEADIPFMFSKVRMLQKHGYLPTMASEADPKLALDDAARACMIDQECD